MKKSIFLLAAALNILIASSSFAGSSSATGKVTFVGTLSEQYDQGYHVRFRVRLAESTCDNDQTPKTRWIHVRTGRMADKYTHNMANARNAYNTVMTAFLSNHLVQIDGLPSCDSTKVLDMDLWNSSIGILR